MDPTLKGFILGIIVGVILLFIQRLWSSKGEKITEESFQHQLMLHKEQKFSEIEMCLVVIKVIGEALSGHFAVSQTDIEKEIEEFFDDKYALPKCKKMVGSVEKIISGYRLSIQTNTKLRHALEPLFYIASLNRDVTMSEFLERFSRSAGNLGALAKELEDRQKSIEAN